MKLLPGEQNQPVRLLPAAAAAAAGVHLAVLHAAHGPQEAHLRAAAVSALQRRCTTRAQSRRVARICRPNTSNRPAARRVAPTRPSSCSCRTSPPRRPGVALVVLIVLYVGSQLVSTLIVTATRRSQPAPADAAAAGRLRGDSLQVPGRAAGVLDHDQPVDDRPAVLHPTAHAAARHRSPVRRRGSSLRRSGLARTAARWRGGEESGRRWSPRSRAPASAARLRRPPRKKKKRSGRRR